jgi:hypothetical protein
MSADGFFYNIWLPFVEEIIEFLLTSEILAAAFFRKFVPVSVCDSKSYSEIRQGFFKLFQKLAI